MRGARVSFSYGDERLADSILLFGDDNDRLAAGLGTTTETEGGNVLSDFGNDVLEAAENDL